MTMSHLLLRWLTARPVRSLMNALLGHYVTIYMIHRPTTDDGAYDGLAPELLDKAIGYAKENGFEFAALDDLISDALVGRHRTNPTLCFTLDDGYQDQLDLLVPVLLAHQCQPTLFVLVDMIDNLDWPWDSQLAFALWTAPAQRITITCEGQTLHFDLDTKESRKLARRQLTRLGKNLPATQLVGFKENIIKQLNLELPAAAPTSYLPATWNSLRQAEAAGLRIGSHACSHRVFTALSTEEIAAELARAKQRLAQELVNPSQIFCYPSGTARDFLPEHFALIRDAGHNAAVTSISGNTNQSTIRSNPYTIHRHSFPPNLETFIRYSSWLEYIRSRL